MMSFEGCMVEEPRESIRSVLDIITRTHSVLHLMTKGNLKGSIRSDFPGYGKKSSQVAQHRHQDWL